MAMAMATWNEIMAAEFSEMSITGEPTSNSEVVGQGTEESEEPEEESNKPSISINKTIPVQDPEEITGIRDVWAHNLRNEFKTIRQLVRDAYNFIAMDTEFPGTVARPIGSFHLSSDYFYQLLVVNCNMLRLIQLGLTFMDKDGKTPPGGISTWQFNFKFSLTEDMYADESVALLINSGIPFEKLKTDGIDPFEFSELMISSGLVLNEDVTWIAFHSGYDFGYLYRILSGKKIPEDEESFFDLLKLYFPVSYDVKYLMLNCKALFGGLQEVANSLHVKRLGLPHQAGSDSLVTGHTFFKMKEKYFGGKIDEQEYNGHVYSYKSGFTDRCKESYFFKPKQQLALKCHNSSDEKMPLQDNKSPQI